MEKYIIVEDFFDSGKAIEVPKNLAIEAAVCSLQYVGFKICEIKDNYINSDKFDFYVRPADFCCFYVRPADLCSAYSDHIDSCIYDEVFNIFNGNKNTFKNLIDYFENSGLYEKDNKHILYLKYNYLEFFDKMLVKNVIE